MHEEIINILLVDDNSDYVSVVKHHLRTFQRKRFETTWVNSGDKVLEHLRSNAPVDLVLMDYYLPNDNGVEIIKKIYEAKISVPIILLTSNKDFRVAIETMKYGVEDYLIKEEVSDTILSRTIINVLERVQLNKKLAVVEKEKIITEERMQAVQELVVTMCHEFNNPLAAVKISSDILLRQSITAYQKEILAKLNKNVLYLEKQIIKLRDFTIEK